MQVIPKTSSGSRRHRLKSLSSGFLALSLALGSASIVFGGDLVNPGFEDSSPLDDVGSDQAFCWDRWGQWMNRMTNEPGWQSRRGDAFLVYQHWRADSAESGWFQDVSNLVAGCRYRFTVWASRDANCNAGIVELIVSPAGGGTPYRVERFGPREIGRHWTLTAVHAKLPDNATAARFSIRCLHGFTGDTSRAQGAIRFDDADVQMLAVSQR